MKHKVLLPVLILMLAVPLVSCGTGSEESTPAEPAQLVESALLPETERQPETRPPSVWIGLQSAGNARQLGGIPTQGGRAVKQNVILRAGEFTGLTAEEEEILVSEYELAHIIDLRDEIEAEASSDPAMDGVQNHHFIVWPRAIRERIMQESTTAQGFDSELYTQNYYTAFALEPDAIEAYRQMFGVLMENEQGSVLIHCVHGKDRTGIAVTLILSALGARWDEIESEYLLSNTAYAGSVDISSLRFYKSVIEESYGSIENYLESEMNLDDNDLEALRGKYTEPVT